MNNSVTISAEQYQELLRKAAAYDSLEAQFKAVSAECEQLKGALEQSQARYEKATEDCRQLADALAEALKKNEELDADNKNLREQVTKFKDMAFGNKGNRPSKKEQMEFELRNQPNLFSEYEDEELNESMQNLADLTKEAQDERDAQKEAVKAQKEAAKAAARAARKRRKKTAKEREAELAEKYKSLPVHETVIYPDGYDPEKHIIIGEDRMDILHRNPPELHIVNVVV